VNRSIIFTMYLFSQLRSLSILQIFAKHKKVIIFTLYGQYIYLFGLTIYAAYLTYHQIDRAVVYEWGKASGDIALIYFCLSILPGIARRFGIRTQITQILMLFRRQIGISVFLFGFFHYSAIRLFPILFAGVPLNLHPPLFEVFGFLSLYPMTLLFLTSNDVSVRTMKTWWRRVHSLVYILTWTIFLHVVLQSGGVMAWVIGAFAFLEAGSLVYPRLRKK